MNKTKTTYERPTTELFVIRFEENICLSYGKQGDAGIIDDEDDVRNYSF